MFVFHRACVCARWQVHRDRTVCLSRCCPSTVYSAQVIRFLLVRLFAGCCLAHQAIFLDSNLFWLFTSLIMMCDRMGFFESFFFLDFLQLLYYEGLHLSKLRIFHNFFSLVFFFISFHDSYDKTLALSAVAPWYLKFWKFFFCLFLPSTCFLSVQIVVLFSIALTFALMSTIYC